MANKHRGEIAINVSGVRYKLRLTTNSICELEDLGGRPIGDILDELSNVENVRMSTLRQFFWALMLDDNPDAELKDAGALIDGLKGRHTEVLAEAVHSAFPDAQEGDNAGE